MMNIQQEIVEAYNLSESKRKKKAFLDSIALTLQNLYQDLKED